MSQCFEFAACSVFRVTDSQPDTGADDVQPPDPEQLNALFALMEAASLLEHQIEQHLRRFKADSDDYSDILLKALADRLAEAFAERLHERVRKTLWGYAPDEALANEDLVREKYRGIRPAPGYPACPDHSQKPELFRLLNAGQNAGLTLTESFAMIPISAVSGYYFAHPEAQYFGVARIGKDQVEDYAQRRGIPVELAEKYLRPNMGY